MFHACIRRFDVTGTRKFFFGTKRPLSLLQVGFFPSRNSAKSHSMLAACIISSCMHACCLVVTCKNPSTKC